MSRGALGGGGRSDFIGFEVDLHPGLADEHPVAGGELRLGQLLAVDADPVLGIQINDEVGPAALVDARMLARCPRVVEWDRALAEAADDLAVRQRVLLVGVRSGSDRDLAQAQLLRGVTSPANGRSASFWRQGKPPVVTLRGMSNRIVAADAVGFAYGRKTALEDFDLTLGAGRLRSCSG